MDRTKSYVIIIIRRISESIVIDFLGGWVQGVRLKPWRTMTDQGPK